MRVWDIPVERLCEIHAQAEHRSMHKIVETFHELTDESNNPEVKRWEGRLDALKRRHDNLMLHARSREWSWALEDNTPLESTGDERHPYLYAVTPLRKQVEKLMARACECNLDGMPGGRK